MIFEYDPAKSVLNKQKHGVDFEEAQELWKDDKRLESESGRIGEERFFVIGKIGAKIWTAIVTYRENNIRIISVRRARENEEDLYYERQE